MFRLRWGILSLRRRFVGACWCGNPRTCWWVLRLRDLSRVFVACGTLEAAENYQQALDVFIHIQWVQEQSATSTLCIVHCWSLLVVNQWRKYFENPLNPTDMPSNREAWPEDPEVGCPTRWINCYVCCRAIFVATSPQLCGGIRCSVLLIIICVYVHANHRPMYGHWQILSTKNFCYFDELQLNEGCYFFHFPNFSCFLATCFHVSNFFFLFCSSWKRSTEPALVGLCAYADKLPSQTPEPMWVLTLKPSPWISHSEIRRIMATSTTAHCWMDRSMCFLFLHCWTSLKMWV